MALIQINEVKRQKPAFVQASASVKQLEAMMPDISKRIMNGESAFFILDHLSFVDDRLKNNVRGKNDPVDALNIIYNGVGKKDSIPSGWNMNCQHYYINN